MGYCNLVALKSLLQQHCVFHSFRYTRLWPLAVAYISFMWWDRDTCNRWGTLHKWEREKKNAQLIFYKNVPRACCHQGRSCRLVCEVDEELELVETLLWLLPCQNSQLPHLQLYWYKIKVVLWSKVGRKMCRWRRRSCLVRAATSWGPTLTASSAVVPSQVQVFNYLFNMFVFLLLLSNFSHHFSF